MAPDLYLNIFTPRDPNLFVLGMIEASGIGWQGRYEQAELVAAYLRAPRGRPGRGGGRSSERVARVRRRTCPAATTTWGSSGWPTTSTRTPTAAPCAREIERLRGAAVSPC